MSLTHTAYTTRNLIKFGGIGIIIFSLSWSIITGSIKAYRKAHPPKIAPTVRYGKLPPINFPDFTPKVQSFNLELANDDFPKITDQAKVFILYRSTSTLLALEKDIKTAQKMGFVSKPQKLSNGLYRFENKSVQKTLTMNVLDGSFRIEYPYKKDQSIQMDGNPPIKEEAVSIATSFLNTAEKMTEDLKDGKQIVSFWKITFKSLEPVSSLSEANAIRVDFIRQDLDGKFKIYSIQPQKSPISILISNSRVENKKIIEVDYKYAPIDRQSYSTYPIKTPQQAWQDLKNGNYWSPTHHSSTSLTIRQLELAYFEPNTQTNYIQPIFVFRGDHDFIAYVPAVSSEWISSN
ncbi:hypothetical protein DRH14_00860 [Candidatus Shapirobacteria bacterium]|nr:MAG: hypothetical protein DRH14_00860 [Candidatus Shapirobacteria bacterium]